jgi:hypothetical protein
MFKVTLNDDGFFMEAHVKLRPVDCATDGVFICGLAHAPKSLDESITQAQAAATRAVTLLAKETIRVAARWRNQSGHELQLLRGVRFHLPLFGAVLYRAGPIYRQRPVINPIVWGCARAAACAWPPAAAAPSAFPDGHRALRLASAALCRRRPVHSVASAPVPYTA